MNFYFPACANDDLPRSRIFPECTNNFTGRAVVEVECFFSFMNNIKSVKF